MTLSEADLTRLRHVHAGEVERLLTLPGVVGAGVGHEEVGGTSTGRPALRVYVEAKVPNDELRAEHRVPRTLRHADGTEVRVDVIETGRFRALGFDTYVRPVPDGYSLAHASVSAGTLGCVATHTASGRRVLLSNNHVLAFDDRAQPGDPVLQPGRSDITDPGYPANQERYVVARLTSFVPLVFLEGENEVDAAIAEPLSPELLTGRFPTEAIDEAEAHRPAVGLLFGSSGGHAAINPIDVVCRELGISLDRPVATVSVDDVVMKCGRTSGLTEGVVVDVHAHVVVDYQPGGPATFVRQVLASLPAEHGDSGALVVRGA